MMDYFPKYLGVGSLWPVRFPRSAHTLEDGSTNFGGLRHGRDQQRCTAGRGGRARQALQQLLPVPGRGNEIAETKLHEPPLTVPTQLPNQWGLPPMGGVNNLCFLSCWIIISKHQARHNYWLFSPVLPSEICSSSLSSALCRATS